MIEAAPSVQGQAPWQGFVQRHTLGQHEVQGALASAAQHRTQAGCNNLGQDLPAVNVVITIRKILALVRVVVHAKGRKADVGGATSPDQGLPEDIPGGPRCSQGGILVHQPHAVLTLGTLYRGVLAICEDEHGHAGAGGSTRNGPPLQLPLHDALGEAECSAKAGATAWGTLTRKQHLPQLRDSGGKLHLLCRIRVEHQGHGHTWISQQRVRQDTDESLHNAAPGGTCHGAGTVEEHHEQLLAAAADAGGNQLRAQAAAHQRRVRLAAQERDVARAARRLWLPVRAICWRGRLSGGTAVQLRAAQARWGAVGRRSRGAPQPPHQAPGHRGRDHEACSVLAARQIFGLHVRQVVRLAARELRQQCMELFVDA
mmetsp:Transcript_29391/g.84429  ORF Transcript_29391/g.84429 Transcript_29391/m.84429 type:complete len:371 (+) Transcript_29391:1674-2786(+)